jgi:hypothetical protein
MHKTVIICEGCRRTKLNGQYYSLAYKDSEAPSGKTEDFCSKGCLQRRLSLVLTGMDNCIIARCEIDPGNESAGDNAVKPIVLSGSG